MQESFKTQVLRNVLPFSTIESLKEIQCESRILKEKPYNIEKDPQLLRTLPLLNPYLKDILPPFEVSYAHFLTQTLPYIIHTDGPSSEVERQRSDPFVVILVPLTIDGDSAHLITFDQRYEGSGSAFLRGSSEDSLEVYNTVRDYSQVLGLGSDPFFYSNEKLYLEHLDQESLFGLKVEQIIEWKTGDIILFDRCRLHCSSSFKSFGLRSKSSLTLGTELRKIPSLFNY